MKRKRNRSVCVCFLTKTGLKLWKMEEKHTTTCLWNTRYYPSVCVFVCVCVRVCVWVCGHVSVCICVCFSFISFFFFFGFSLYPFCSSWFLTKQTIQQAKQTQGWHCVSLFFFFFWLWSQQQANTVKVLTPFNDFFSPPFAPPFCSLEATDELLIADLEEELFWSFFLFFLSFFLFWQFLMNTKFLGKWTFSIALAAIAGVHNEIPLQCSAVCVPDDISSFLSFVIHTGWVTPINI